MHFSKHNLASGRAYFFKATENGIAENLDFLKHR